MGHTHVDETPKVSGNAAMWFSVLVIFLLVAAINFVKVSSGGHDSHHDAHATEHAGSGHAEGTDHQGAAADGHHAEEHGDNAHAAEHEGASH